MPAAAIVTLVLTALIVVAAAVGLLRVVLHLYAVHRTLGNLIDGLHVVARRTEPVPEVLPSVNANLEPVRDFCESI